MVNGADSPEAGEGPLLGVFAHPDDETLTGGAALALAASRGRRVVVVTATRGERGEIIPRELAHLEGIPDAVAALRTGELAAALRALGVGEHAFLDELVSARRADGGTDPIRLTDSGMQWIGPALAGPASEAGPDAFAHADLDECAEALAATIRSLRPQTIVTEEPGGGYGHPDHVRVHEVTVRAVELAAAPSADGAPAWQTPVLAWLVREEDRLRVGRAQVREQAAESLSPASSTLTLPEPDAPAPSIARDSSDVDLVADATLVMPAVLDALRSHVSQIQAISIPVLDVDPPQPGELSADQASVGWLALSRGELSPIAPIAALQVGRGDVEALGLGPDVRSAPPPRARAGVLSLTGVLMVVFCAVLGVLIGLGGTAMHRWMPPLGVVLALVAVVSSSLLARGLARGPGLLALGLTLVGTIQAMTFLRPGGDVLVSTDAPSTIWLYGSVLACGLCAFAYRRWFGERQ